MTQPRSTMTDEEYQKFVNKKQARRLQKANPGMKYTTALRQIEAQNKENN